MLAPGTRLAAYEILEPVGAGGMGEVYRAKDTRLGREVAVKIVSEKWSHDAAALARLQREARVVAALSHPNILSLHDVGSDQGVMFVVMELLDGEPLDRRLASGPIDRAEGLRIATALCDGLSSAHAKGVVHRDLKPANIFITRDGHVKILDFGLAKRDPFLEASDTAETAVAGETQPGALLGTLGYMSPEQVHGESADERSDIFSLGCVLYEVFGGAQAFHGKTPAETLAAILRDQPPALDPRQVPARLSAVLGRCLAKDPHQRFQSAKDLGFALQTTAVPRSRTPVAPLLIVAAATIIIAAAVWVLPKARTLFSAGERIRSLAVLPLANLSGDHDQDYFADAMTEELTNRLAKLGSWRVTSRTSVMSYRGAPKNVREIARELDVDAVIEGSVIRDASHVKVSAELVDARTDRQIWADEYEREPASVLVIQNDVARAIARQVSLTVTPDADAALVAATRPVLPAAYDEYVRGRHAWDKRTEADLRDAIRHFLKSIDADATYAPAYAGLADCYGQLGYGSYIAPEDAFPRARAAAEQALHLDATLADAHASLGYALMYYDWDFAGAEKEFAKAIAINPNYAIAHQWRAYLLTATEHPLAEAEHEIALAKHLDQLSVPINIDRAYILHYYRQDAEALRSVNLALEMNSTFPPAFFWLGRIYTSAGRYADAEAALQHIGPLRTWTPAMATLGYLYARSGRVREARGVLAEFDDLLRQGKYASSYAIAIIHAGLGERDATFKALDAAYHEKSHWLVWLKRDPRWDDVRTDPRFVDLVHKVGLPR